MDTLFELTVTTSIKERRIKFENAVIDKKLLIFCRMINIVAGGHKLQTRSCFERVYSQIRRHMLRHKHIGPTRWHHKEDDEDVEHDEHEHDEHGDAKRDQTWRH